MLLLSTCLWVPFVLKFRHILLTGQSPSVQQMIRLKYGVNHTFTSCFFGILHFCQFASSMHVISLLVIVLPMQYFPQIFFYMVIEKKNNNRKSRKEEAGRLQKNQAVEEQTTNAFPNTETSKQAITDSHLWFMFKLIHLSCFRYFLLPSGYVLVFDNSSSPERS